MDFVVVRVPRAQNKSRAVWWPDTCEYVVVDSSQRENVEHWDGCDIVGTLKFSPPAADKPLPETKDPGGAM